MRKYLQRVNWELVFVALCSFFLVVVQTRLKLNATPAFFDGTLVRNQGLLMKLEYTNNEQSRILQFLLPALFSWVFHMTIPAAYVLQRVLFVTLAYVAFYVFLRKWFRPVEAFVGPALLAAFTPMTFMNDLQESCNLLLLMFVLALHALRERRLVLFSLALFVGALDNESILILAMSCLFWTKSARKTALACLPAFLVSAVIRYITRKRPHLGGAWHLPDNLKNVWAALHHPVSSWTAEWYLKPFFIFGAFWIFSALAWKKCPDFFRKTSICIPFFVMANMITGIILEVRQLVPLGVFLIPMSMFYLESAANAVKARADSPQSP
jgi:hypothetical protein